MAMALPQDLAWKPSSSSFCLLQTPVHQRLQNKGKKAENNNTTNNKIQYYCSKKREKNKKSNNLVIVYCSSIREGTLETFVEKKGPPPKVKKKFFKDTERREKLWREFFLDPSQWWDGRPEKVNRLLSQFSSCMWNSQGLVGAGIDAFAFSVFLVRKAWWVCLSCEERIHS
jgi:hypothetical protein